ncbi:MAG: type III-A CRISPR-associated RAMP protein Csm3 [bacterium]|nr:type III-A CRISPR-associated RAMP protein Csm3 [bacterium]
MEKFIGKLFIEGEITLLTGLHIGGSKETGEIGGLDNPVIKTIRGIPYIPGSSLKGKIRCLLERKGGFQPERNEGEPCGCGSCNICLLFGAHSNKNRTISRLIVRDSYLDEEQFIKEVLKNSFEDITYTEEKTENIIDRIKGTAQHPRIMERVPAGAKFKFFSSISFYERDDINSLTKSFIEGLRLLEDDYLGGSGTRGYGHIKFNNLAFYIKNIESYIKNNEKIPITTSKDLSSINIEEIYKEIYNKLQVNQK